MEDILSWKKRRLFVKNNLSTLLAYFLIVGIINLLVLLAINQLSFIHYETNDDFMIQSLLNGSLGESYIQFPHTNYLLHTVIAQLYQFTPSINWYGLFLVSCLFISATVVGAVFMDKAGFGIGLALYLATVPVYYGLFLTQFQYTMVAYSLLIASVAGLLHAFSVKKKSTRIFLYVISAFMLILGIALRHETWVSALIYLGVICLLMLWQHKKRALSFVTVVAISMIAVGLLAGLNQAYYNSSSEMKDFKQFHEDRIELVDRAPLNYETHAEAFSAVGWTENDTKLFGKFVYPDGEKFSKENLEKIIAARANVTFMTDGSAILSGLAAEFYQSNVTMLCLLIVLFLVLFLVGKKKLSACMLLALPFAVQVMLEMLWRPAFRAVYPHYVLSIITLIMMLDLSEIKSRSSILQKLTSQEAMKAGRLLSAGLAAVFFVAGGSLLLSVKWDGETKKSQKMAIEYFAAHPEDVYLYSTSCSLMGINESYSVFYAFPKNYLINNRPLGGWNTRSPSYNDFKERYGFSSLPDDLADRENVYFVAESDTGLLAQYFFDDCGINVNFEKMEQLGDDLFVYRIVSASNDTIA